MMSAGSLKDDYVYKFNNDGEKKFYRSLLFLALNKLVLIENGMYRGISPHIEYLDYCDKFIFVYRREGDEVFLQIAKILRKASHRIYRIMLKKNMATYNVKFLNSV